MNPKSIILALIGLAAFASPALATFHLMQIEQVVGGLNGDLNAQAIQLRLRAFDEDEVRLSRVRAWNADGKNPVLVLDLTSDVAVGTLGARVLLATPAFTAKVKLLHPSFAPDFTMALPIPPSYLAAGRLTFENDSNTILWSLAWGGFAYTGSHIGAVFNDANGNFGPAFPQGLPTAARRAVRFKGSASALSTSNSLDYTLSANPATVTRNNGASFVIGPVPEIVVEHPAGNSLVDATGSRKFGTVLIGGAGKSKTFTLRNTGNAALTGLKITKSGANTNDFLVAGLSKTTLAAGTKTTFKVTFVPKAIGTRRATIHIKSNDADENPFDVKLTGEGGE